MKKIIFAAAALLLTVACDSVDSDDRYLDIDNGQDAVTIRKRVLLEDYTGALCVNCPYAAQIITDVQSIYPEDVIAVSIHAGGFSTANFRTEAGSAYADRFQVANFPSAIINRKSIDGSLVSSQYDTWTASIIPQLSLEAQMQLALIPVYDAATATLSVQVEVDSRADIADAKILVWLTESGIKYFQKKANADGSVATITDYIHNHVFRGAVNSTWGETLEVLDGVKTVYTSPAISLNSSWVPENMHIVAFVFNAQTNEIYQSVETALIPTQE